MRALVTLMGCVLGAVLGFFVARSLLLDGLEQLALRLALGMIEQGNENMNVAGFLTSSIGIRLEIGIVLGAVGGTLAADKLFRGGNSATVSPVRARTPEQARATSRRITRIALGGVAVAVVLSGAVSASILVTRWWNDRPFLLAIARSQVGDQLIELGIRIEAAHKADVQREIDRRRAEDAAVAADEAKKAREKALAAMKFADRVQAIENECSLIAGHACNEAKIQEVIDYDLDDAERPRLKTTRDAARRKYDADLADAPRVALATEAHRAEVARTKFATDYEWALFEKHMNPTSVVADGTSKKTLHVDGWFCNRQYLHDFVNGDTGRRAVSAGFDKLVCGNSMETWTQEL